MRRALIPYVALLLILTTGCLKQVEETLEPVLDIQIADIEYRNETDEGYKTTSGNSWLYLTLRITNGNDDASVPLTAYHFFIIKDDQEIWCRGFEGEDEPSVEPGKTELFTIYFEVDPTDVFERIEYRRTLEDPIKVDF